MNRRVNIISLVAGLAFITIALLGIAIGTGLLAVETATGYAVPIALVVLGAIALVLSRKN